MPLLPADRDHVTASSVGQLCDGNVCSVCTACASCGRHVGEPHVNSCACPDDQAHYVCEDCVEALAALGITL